MTTAHHPPDTAGPAPEPSLEADLADLRDALADHPFPTRQDDLIADCLGRHQPARLCCRLSRLSRTQVFSGVDEVLAAVRSAAEHAPGATR